MLPPSVSSPALLHSQAVRHSTAGSSPSGAPSSPPRDASPGLDLYTGIHHGASPAVMPSRGRLGRREEPFIVYACQ